MSTLILFILFLAQGRPKLPELKPEDYGRVEGIVTNATTGEPIRRAEVRLSPAERRGPEDPGSLTATTDNAGRFALAKVAPGRFVLRPTRNGFVQKGSTPVTVSSGQSVLNLAITMLPQAVITGRVVDEEGEPIPRITVTAYRYAYPQGRKALVPAESATTNDLGEYRLWGLSRGTFYLAGISFAAGRPRSGDSEPLIPTFHPAASGLDGATPVRLSPGMQLPNLDIQMRRSKTYRVSGVITDAASGQPVSRASVFAMGEAVGLQGGGQRAMSRDGQFSLDGIAPGAYTIVARTFTEGRGDGGSATGVGQLRIEVTSSDLTGVRISLRQPAPIQGLVKLEEGEASLTSMRVQLEPLAASQGGPGTMGSGIKEDGKFTIPNLIPMRYRMRLQNIPTGYFLKAIRQGNQDVHLTGIDTTVAGDLTVLLAPGPGSIEGLVRDSKDQPQAQVSVVLVPKEPWPGVADSIRVATSGADGKYQFTQLTPGDYELYALEDAETGSWFDPEFRAMYRNQAKTVRVEKASTASIDPRTITLN
jgi:hypothetical protein